MKTLKFTHITVDFDVVLQCFLRVEEFVTDPALLDPVDSIFLLTVKTHVLFEVVLKLRREITLRASVKRNHIWITIQDVQYNCYFSWACILHRKKSSDSTINEKSFWNVAVYFSWNCRVDVSFMWTINRNRCERSWHYVHNMRSHQLLSKVMVSLASPSCIHLSHRNILWIHMELWCECELLQC